jgi:membrane protein DedA with SNARE-associated domain
MDLKKFVIYTALGGAIWMCVLIALGYYIGENKELMTTYLPIIKGGMLLFIVLLMVVYTWRRRANARKLAAKNL